MALIVEGLSNKEIAETLRVAEKTVKFHTYNIFKRLKIGSRTKLIAETLRNNYISFPPWLKQAQRIDQDFGHKHVPSTRRGRTSSKGVQRRPGGNRIQNGA